MKLPTKIRVGPITYKVEYEEKPSDVDVHGRRAHWGQIDFWERRISICTKLSKRDQLQAVVHEMVHAILDGIGEKELKKNEKFVVAFSQNLLDTLDRNGFLK